jgi:hypothetical protein
MNRRITRGNALLGAAALMSLLVVQVALAGSPPDSSGDPRVTTSVVSAAKFKKLKKQVAALQQQVDTLARQPGPQGAQGPAGAAGAAGAAPACVGNGSGDTMVAAGSVCIDKYEVSVWSTPTGGTQYGATSDDYPCDDEGQDCKAGTAGAIYARSVAGVTPSRFITYFQAQQALANVGKRLPSNAEWQQAVAGTPDPGPDNGTTDCNTASTFAAANTGSRSACVSHFGANDMVGNLGEWVGDWVPRSTTCLNWDTIGMFSSTDAMCLAGADATDDAPDAPGALRRGGDFFDFDGGGLVAGPFAVEGRGQPSGFGSDTGFRGAR